MPRITLDSLHIYPVKSLKGLNVPQTRATTDGLLHDREWMVVNENGRFVTQRQLPELGQISARLTQGVLALSHPTKGKIEIPANNAGQIAPVSVWKDECEGVLTNACVGQWLTKTCGSASPLQLVQFAPQFKRPPQQQRFGKHSALFADAAPYLLASTASLKALNERLKTYGEPTVEMIRFRPNLVFSGLPAFAEHTITTLQHEPSGAWFELVDHCQRCSIITIDPATAIPHRAQSPFKTLASLNPMPNNAKAPAFGVNSVLKEASPEGVVIKVGDIFSF